MGHIMHGYGILSRLYGAGLAASITTIEGDAGAVWHIEMLSMQ